MSYQERLALYREIEGLRGNPLICYVTSIRPYASGQISSDVIPEFIKQINAIPEEHNEVDLLIASNGGDPNAAARIIARAFSQGVCATALCSFQCSNFNGARCG